MLNPLVMNRVIYINVSYFWHYCSCSIPETLSSSLAWACTFQSSLMTFPSSSEKDAAVGACPLQGRQASFVLQPLVHNSFLFDASSQASPLCSDQHVHHPKHMTHLSVIPAAHLAWNPFPNTVVEYQRFQEKLTSEPATWAWANGPHLLRLHFLIHKAGIAFPS